MGDLAEIRTGKAFSSADFSSTGEYLVITNKNILDETNGIISSGDRINISEDTILNNYLLIGNNILVTMDGVNIGKTGKYSNEKAVLAQRVGRLNSKQFEFVYQITSNDKFVSHMNKLSVGNAIKHISLKQISDYSFSTPIREEEQNHIGIFFKQLDNTIALHQRKLDKLKQLKQGYLKQLLDQTLRFLGFNDEWIVQKLAEITDSFSGGTPTANNKHYYNGTIPFIRSGEINSDKTELFITEEALSNSSARLVNKGDILYALYGATSGEVGIAKISGAINQAILVIRPKFDNNSYFITQWLKKQKRAIISIYLQGGQGNLSGSIIKNLIINLPTKEEQNKIGELFMYFDSIISLQQEKIEQLMKLKKAYLQKMFI